MSTSGQPIDRHEEGVQDTNRASSSQDETQNNADLYAPPAYTIESSLDEERLDVQASVPEKTPLLGEDQPDHHPSDLSPSYTLEPTTTRDSARTPSLTVPPRKPVDWANASKTSIRCSVLTDRPATWTVRKKKGIALSPLAAAILVREGILDNKDLVIAQSLLERPTSSSSLLNPTDPLSAVVVSTYDLLGDIFLGLAGGPLEIARQIGPARSSQRREELARQAQNPLWLEDGARSRDDTLTRGFHNMPKMYGEELREYEEIVDMKTGFVVSGKALGYGIYDGIKDFFVMPIKGAKKEGAAGAGKGFCKGLGNMICNMGEAGCGLVGYSSYGIYKEIQKSNSSGRISARNAVLTLGETELEQATEEERRDVIRRWLQVQMRPN
ncbi:hypothetical protein GRF29_185g353104 [Pseudopithomyces chartarum]|uniref:Uncharacterized protein n=1 Tax=Pseudopithomyces chartarum TaxID=1892770 RepID=A0AAN6LMX5_9PLEO|nr:hypothetical protein GRF29_185g353104 [Pseudopithomyces chartarum]